MKEQEEEEERREKQKKEEQEALRKYNELEKKIRRAKTGRT